MPIKYEAFDGPIAKTVRAACDRLGDSKIESVHTERDGWDEHANAVSYWVYLQPGWINPALDTHLYHESRLDLLDQLKRFPPEPCACEQCRGAFMFR